MNIDEEKTRYWLFSFIDLQSKNGDIYKFTGSSVVKMESSFFDLKIVRKLTNELFEIDSKKGNLCPSKNLMVLSFQEVSREFFDDFVEDPKNPNGLIRFHYIREIQR